MMKRMKALIASVSRADAGARRSLPVAAATTTAATTSGGGGFDEGAAGAGGKNPERAGTCARDRGRHGWRRGHRPRSGPRRRPGLLDPAGLWSVTDNGIAQDLLFRSLTTFRQDENGAYELVPDLATDLGTPNDDFTEWTFTLKDGIKWETGDPVTAEEVAFGIKRSFDADAVRDRPRHVVLQAVLRGRRQVQRPLRRRRGLPGGDQVEGNDIIMKFSTPVRRDGLLLHLPGHRAGAAGRRPAPTTASRRCRPGPTRSRSSCPNQELVLVKNDQWDPDDRPGPSSARRQVHLQVRRATRRWPARPCSATRARPPS